MRPNWDEFFLIQALFYSTRGTCDRLRAACILVKDKIIVGVGYNGSLPGEPHCDEVGHLLVEGHCLRTLHAEANAIRNCSDASRLNGATAYVTATPCLLCLKALVAYGVSRVVFVSVYDNANYQWDRHKDLRTFVESLKRNKAVKIELLQVDFLELLQRFLDRLQTKGGALEHLPKIKLYPKN